MAQRQHAPTAGAGDAGPRPGPVAWLLLLPIRLYRVTLSPLLPPSCRFYPSCSAYAVDALTRHGALRGGYLAARRLLRCNPWRPGGLDPVPERFGWRHRRHVEPETEDAPAAEAAGAGGAPSPTPRPGTPTEE